MAKKIIKLPQRAEEDHGGASKATAPPNALKAKIIKLRFVTLEEFLRAVGENGGDAHSVCGGKALFLVTEPDVNALLKSAPPLPLGTPVPSKEYIDLLLKKSDL